MASQELQTNKMGTSQKVKYRIGSRGSKLALVQSELVAENLRRVNPALSFTIETKMTAGDYNKVTPLYLFGEKALWTAELDELLLSGYFDMIVHCLKDMPTQITAGCAIGAILKREDPRDAVVMKEGLAFTALSELPAGSIVGTSSVRRKAQLKRAFPALLLEDVRGNVPTRLSNLDEADGKMSCVIVAVAGLLRLGLGHRITQHLNDTECLYAVGQGALAVEVRERDSQTIKLLQSMSHWETTLVCYAERSLMRTLEGGCSVPIGVSTQWERNGTMRMKANLTSVDGEQSLVVEDCSRIDSIDEADEFGRMLASLLIEKGASSILKNIELTRSIVNA